MSWRRYQAFTVLLTIGAMVLASVYIIVQLRPKYQERFIAMGILGTNRRAEDYYPGNGMSMKVGDQVHWYIYIYNHWDEANEVSILVKFLNSTMPPPDNLEDEPSPVQPVFEITVVLDENETRLMPFFWHVQDAEFGENMTVISRLTINDETVALNVSGERGSLFRIVFELWLFNEKKEIFEYGWHFRDAHYSVWNGMWFNLTSTSEVDQ